MTIRAATTADAAACAAVYSPYVTGTAITFELEPPSAADFVERIAKAHEWLVATDDDGQVFGYAYAGTFHPRAAYRWAAEVSVYLETGRRRTGAGRALYTALLDRLRDRGYLTVLGGMTEPNPASEGLHRALGFVPVATYRNVGFKAGAWHDVTWFQRDLVTPLPTDPPEPR